MEAEGPKERKDCATQYNEDDFAGLSLNEKVRETAVTSERKSERDGKSEAAKEVIEQRAAECVGSEKKVMDTGLRRKMRRELKELQMQWRRKREEENEEREKRRQEANKEENKVKYKIEREQARKEREIKWLAVKCRVYAEWEEERRNLIQKEVERKAEEFRQECRERLQREAKEEEEREMQAEISGLLEGMKEDLRREVEEEHRKEREREEERYKKLEQHYKSEEEKREREDAEIWAEWSKGKDERKISIVKERLKRTLSFAERQLLTGAWEPRSRAQAIILLELSIPEWSCLSYEKRRAKIRDCLLLSGRWTPMETYEEERLEFLRQKKKNEEAINLGRRKKSEDDEEESWD